MLAQTSAPEIGTPVGILIGAVLLPGLLTILFTVLAIKRRSVIFTILAVFSLMAALVVGGALLIANIRKPTDVKSTDGRFVFTVPRHWSLLPSVKKLSPDADLVVGNLIRAEYMTLVVEEKPDAPITLKIMSDTVADMTRQKMPEARIGEAVSLKIGDWEALQREVGGRVSGHDVVWLQTVIETEDAWLQLTGWTLASKKSRALPLIRDAVKTLRRARPALPPQGKATHADHPAQPKIPPPLEPVAASDPEAAAEVLIAEVLGNKTLVLTPSTKLKDDLGMDELDVIELVIALEENFQTEIPDATAEKFTTWGDVLAWATEAAKQTPSGENVPDTSSEGER